MRRLHLACGRIRKEGYINIDRRPLPAVDVVRDVLRGLPFDDDSVDEIYSENFLEHLPRQEVICFMNEMWRVLKPGAKAHHLLADVGTVMYTQDPTHDAIWCFETFTYYTLGHRRNLYYAPDIKGWIIEQLDHTVPNQLIDVIMRKPTLLEMKIQAEIEEAQANQ
jgi:SAM-dependent methyltransferase